MGVLYSIDDDEIDELIDSGRLVDGGDS